MCQARCSISIGLWEEYCPLLGILNNNLSPKLFIYLHYFGEITIMYIISNLSKQNKNVLLGFFLIKDKKTRCYLLVFTVTRLPLT